MRRPLGELLLAAGKLTEAQLRGMLERQRREGGKLGERLVAEGLVTDEELVAAIGEQLGIPFIAEHQLRALPVPTPLLSLLPLEHAERFEAVPLMLQGKELFCAMREPQNLERLDELQFRTGYAVRGILASEGAIRRTINRFYRGDDPQVGLDWANMMKVSASETQLGVMPFADKHTGTRERVLDETTFTPPPPAAGCRSRLPLLSPRALHRARWRARCSSWRMIRSSGMRPCACSRGRASRRPAAPARRPSARWPWAGSRWPSSRATPSRTRPTVVARLLTVAPTMEVRVLPSLAEALGGEAGPLGRAARLHARVLDAALAALGRRRGAGRGAGQAGPARGAPARSGRAEAERASAAAYAMACTARLEGKDLFVRPSCEAVRALLGRDAGELGLRARRPDGRQEGCHRRVARPWR